MFVHLPPPSQKYESVNEVLKTIDIIHSYPIKDNLEF